MGINKVQYGNTTLIDLTNDTVTADKLIQGYTAHDRSGTLITGTAPEGGDVPVWQGTDEYVYLSDTAQAPVEIYVDDDGYVVLDLPPAVLNLQTKTKTYTPTTSQQTDVITYDNGYDGLEEVDITVNAVAAGTAGTPTATKGAVANHSVSVTPSVTNTTGYITGGTKTGTAVTVSASELVSGSETKTANGTYDVTNLASLVVNVGGTSKNAQVVQQSATRIATTTYGKACGDITVSTAGTYHVYWTAYRTSTSGTWGTRLYINGAASSGTAGTEQTTFNSYYQAIHLSNVSLSKNDVVSVYGKSRGTNYYLYVGQLTIIEA